MESISPRRGRLLATAAFSLLAITPTVSAEIVVVAPDARGAVEQAGADLAAARNAKDLADDPSERAAATAQIEQADNIRDTAMRDARERAKRAAAIRAKRPRAIPKPTPLPDIEIIANRVNPYLNTPTGVQRQAEYRQPVTVAALSISTGVAGEIDSYLTSKGSPLSGYGSVFVSEAARSGMDPRFLVAISGAETAFGTYRPSQRINNPFGLGPGIVYSSWPAAIAAAARTLSGRLYKGSGNVTIATIQPVWAPNGAANDPGGLNSHWQRNVGNNYSELGGNPAASVYSGVAAPVSTATTTVQAYTAGTTAQSVASGPPVAVPGGGSGVGPSAASDAIGFLGLPYLWGGTLPSTGFDCSGLIQYVYGKRGVVIPRVAEDQAKVGIPIAPQELQAGDALFFADPTGYIHHEGMYLGGGMFIHSPKTGDVIKISSLYEDYYATQYAGARRY